MAKVTSVVSDVQFSSRTAARAFIIAIKYSESLSRVDSFKRGELEESWRRIVDALKFRKERLVAFDERRKRRNVLEPAKYFPIPINFPLHQRFRQHSSRSFNDFLEIVQLKNKSQSRRSIKIEYTIRLIISLRKLKITNKRM